MRDTSPQLLRIFAAGFIALGAGLFGVSLSNPPPAQSQQQGFTFALMGDLGYAPSEEPWLENVLAEISNDDALSFVVHVGDLSSAHYGCTDDVQSRRLAQFNALPHPLVYTPGDNEWTRLSPRSKGAGPRSIEPTERTARPIL
ncbi:MAG: hypothetical protein GEU95_11795 [Rhizobiales bacterium]|nr:hypothetical protein [Hyphomicrobiales bacterium]